MALGDGIGKDLYKILPSIYRKYDHSPRTVNTDPQVQGLDPVEPIYTPIIEAYPLVYPNENQQFLLRFLRIFGDNLDNLWEDMEALMTLQDADRCAYKYLELLAANLGMKLDASFSEKFRRLFIKNIIWIYQNKGTNVGIIGAIKRITGYDAVIIEFNNHYYYWEIGVHLLGVSTILGIGGHRWWMFGVNSLGIDTILGDGVSHYLDDKEWAGLYTFIVYVFAHCDAELSRLLRAIVAYMKPAHTHHICPHTPEPVPLDWSKEDKVCCVYDLEEYADYSDWILGDDLMSYIGISTVIGTGT